LRILEVGGSNNVLKANLANYFKANGLDHEILTLDLDPTAFPDIVGDVRAMPLEDRVVDVTVCCEVLEHMPFEDVGAALRELHRVSRGFVVVTMPHTSVYLASTLRTPRRRVKSLVLNLLEPSFLKFRRRPLEWSHHWEIGYKGYSLTRLRELVRKAGFSIQRDFRNPLFPTHHFFFLKVEESPGKGSSGGAL
jgi:ubiquinone/menaquinone biosynthesis C-methylase UbiE